MKRSTQITISISALAFICVVISTIDDSWLRIYCNTIIGFILGYGIAAIHKDLEKYDEKEND